MRPDPGQGLIFRVCAMTFSIIKRTAFLFGLLLTTASSWAFSQAQNHHRGDYVVLLHGMGRGAFSMKRMEWFLKGQGDRVVNVSYPSTSISIDDAAEHWLADLLAQRIKDPEAKIHFVVAVKSSKFRLILALSLER
jgi:hypothetical protein